VRYAIQNYFTSYWTCYKQTVQNPVYLQEDKNYRLNYWWSATRWQHRWTQENPIKITFLSLATLHFQSSWHFLLPACRELRLNSMLVFPLTYKSISLAPTPHQSISKLSTTASSWTTPPDTLAILAFFLFLIQWYATLLHIWEKPPPNTSWSSLSELLATTAGETTMVSANCQETCSNGKEVAENGGPREEADHIASKRPRQGVLCK